MSSTRRWSWLKLAGLLALLFLIANCSGGGCSGGCAGCDQMSEIPGGFPAGQRIENGIQVRLSEHGVQFIESNAAGIIGDLMPTGLTFDIPPQCDIDTGFLGIVIDMCGTGDTNNCVSDQPPCTLEIEIVELILTPQDPPGNVMDVEARVNVWTQNSMQTHGGISCDIDLDTRNGQAYVRVQTTATFTIDAVSGRTGVQIGALTIPDGDIENGDISISGGILCWVVDAVAKGMIIDQLRGQIDSLAGPLVSDGLCMACDQGQACPQLSTCDGSQCLEDSAAGCVMALGMEGRLDIGSMLASLAPGKVAHMDINAWLGGYAATNNNGISLGMHGGALSPTHSDCVPQRDPPDLTPAPIAAAFQGNTRPTDNQTFEVGIGIHKKFLDAAGYAVYDSGMLCLDVGPNETAFLTSGTFVVMMGSLMDLLHDEEAPIVVAVRPQNPLTFELSEPDIVQDPGTGEYTMNTPLMTIRSQGFAIDFYALVDYRFIRLFRLNADLAIPLGLAVNGQNQIVPIIGDLGDAFENIVVTDSDLLAEDPATLAAIFPTLIGMVAGMLGSAIAPIDLPDMQGFSLVIDEGGITSVEGDTMLAIYANLAYQAPAPKNGRAQVRTTAALLEQYTPPLASFRLRPAEEFYRDMPSVTLELGGLAPDGSDAALEWQYRFNGGLWSLFTDSPIVTLRRPLFFLQGRHHIDVRARVKGTTATLDPNPVRIDFVVDAVPPRLAVLREGDVLHFSATDNVTPPDALEYSVRLGNGLWSPWQASLTGHTLPAGYDGQMAVRVRDEAGNETVEGDAVLALYGRVKVPPSDSSCGCRQGAPGDAVWLILVALGLLVARRRRQGAVRRPGGRRLPFLVVALALAAPGTACKCGDSPGNNNNLCPDGGIDLVCSNPNLDCPPGQELTGTDPMTLDASDCQPIPVLCECTGDLLEVDPGDYGRFLSIDARDGQVVVSCYSDRYTDLVVATWEGTGLAPEPVDGVPAGPVDYDPNGYRGGVRAKGENAGTFTSAKIAADGTVYVSYVYETTGTLKVARGTPGSWELHEVESYPDETTRVWYTDLQLLPDGRPAVAYMVNGLPDPATPGAFTSELRYAVAQVAEPADASDWVVEVADSTPMRCTGLCASDEVCVQSTLACTPEDPSCGGCGTNEGCVAGACVPIWPDTGFTAEHPEGTGLFVHAGLLSDGRPVLAYHDRSAAVARIAIHDGAAWNASIVEGDSWTDIGLYISMTIDASDVIHLAYHDASPGHDYLLYAQLDSTGALLTREMIDDGTRPDGNLVVGLDSVIFFDGNTPTVLYQDGTDAELWVATRNGANDWTTALLHSGPAGYSFFVDAAVDTDGTIWIAEYIYEVIDEELTYRLDAFTY
ncbi:MAG: MYXO-CTERM sorting domain-containing protein [bacterium]